MKTAPAQPPVLDAQALADEEAVLKHLTEGTPIPEDVARRIDARAERIIEQIRHTHGVIEDHAGFFAARVEAMADELGV